MAAGLGLCATSSMESRLHFLYDLFHPEYGSVATPTDMECGGRLLSMQELIFLSFTVLRCLNCWMHGHIDHVELSMHEVKHSVVGCVRNMEGDVRG